MQQPQQRVREVMWSARDQPGLEHLRLTWVERGASMSASSNAEIAALANGLVIGVDGQAPFRAQYRIACDGNWRARTAQITCLSGDQLTQTLGSDGEGHWFDNAGKSLPALDGCSDLDISATPFTNTLPIRRLALQPGRSTEIAVVYIAVPSLRLSTARQRYERLEDSAAGAVYRFTALASGFTAELVVDGDGLVLDYPGMFQRVWPTP